jgi:hypothetical protein
VKVEKLICKGGGSGGNSIGSIREDIDDSGDGSSDSSSDTHVSGENGSENSGNGNKNIKNDFSCVMYNETRSYACNLNEYSSCDHCSSCGDDRGDSPESTIDTPSPTTSCDLSFSSPPDPVSTMATEMARAIARARETATATAMATATPTVSHLDVSMMVTSDAAAEPSFVCRLDVVPVSGLDDVTDNARTDTAKLGRVDPIIGGAGAGSGMGGAFCDEGTVTVSGRRDVTSYVDTVPGMGDAIGNANPKAVRVANPKAVRSKLGGGRILCVDIWHDPMG